MKDGILGDESKRNKKGKGKNKTNVSEVGSGKMCWGIIWYYLVLFGIIRYNLV